MRSRLERGESVVEPLKATEVFPNMVSQMIAIGEQTGALDAMLGKIADFYEQEVDAAIAGLLTLIEPVMIGFPLAPEHESRLKFCHAEGRETASKSSLNVWWL